MGCDHFTGEKSEAACFPQGSQDRGSNQASQWDSALLARRTGRNLQEDLVGGHLIDPTAVAALPGSRGRTARWEVRVGAPVHPRGGRVHPGKVTTRPLHGGRQACWSPCCLVTQLCPTLCDPVDCGQPGSSVHGIVQAMMLEWVVMPLSRGSS